MNGTVGRRRPVHPLAWWGWAGCLAVGAMQTTDPNPFLLLLIGAVACFVVASCRGDAPWSRSLAFFLRLGLIVVVIRVAIEILFGQRGVPGHVLFTLPHVPLPSWAAAVSIGGAVTLESILTAFVLGLQIAVILVCFGAANSLVSPYRLLRCLPAVLYEAGVAVTVALSFTPELVETIAAVRRARRLRGIPTSGLRGMRGIAVPVLEGALDRSLQLATSMDARGYGRRMETSRSTRVLALGATGAGLLAGHDRHLRRDRRRAPCSDWDCPSSLSRSLLCAVGLGGRRPRGCSGPAIDPTAGAYRSGRSLRRGSRCVAAMALRERTRRARRSASRSSRWRCPRCRSLPVAGILVAALPAFIAPARRSTASPRPDRSSRRPSHDPLRRDVLPLCRGASAPTLDAGHPRDPRGRALRGRR